jgi:hypothetical protein
MSRRLLVIILSLAAGGLLTWWLWVRFHVLFVFIFVPLIAIGPSLFRRLITHENESRKNNNK